MQDLIGRTLGHYRIVEKIGEGGMGVVYRAHDKRLDRDVAIKVLPEKVANDSDRLRRFEREAKAVAVLSHPNILEIHDFDTDGDVTYSVTELLEGETLREHLRKEPSPLPMRKVQEIGAEVTKGLGAAHGKGVVHRDIKPSNIFLCADGRVKILDFGLAATHEIVDAEAETGSLELPLTREGIVLGTIGYMSPEQLRGKPADCRTDIFALGCVLYEMLAGRRAFPGDSDIDVMAATLSYEPMPLSKQGISVPAHFEQLLSKALAKDPENRYSDASGLLADLCSAEAGIDARIVRPRLTSDFQTRRRRWFVVSTTILLAATATVLYVMRTEPALAFASRDWILVSDFDNQTGEPLFDKALVTAFTVSLEQSQHANVFPRSRLPDIFKWMGMTEVEYLDLRTGREVCQRANIRGLVACAIGRIGDQYFLTARLVDPKTGVAVRSYSASASDQDQILDSLGLIARDLRGDLGESLLQIQQSDQPLAHVTTSSLEALRLYTEARLQWRKTRFGDAVTLYHEALEHDPDFAMAHAALGTCYSSFIFNDRTRGLEHFEKALALTDRMTDRERLSIEASYRSGMGHWDEAIRLYKLYLALYPDDIPARYSLGTIYMNGGQPEKAIDEFQQVLRVDSRHASSFVNIAASYALMGSPCEAVSYFEEAFALEPERITGHLNHEYGFTLINCDRIDRAREVFSLAMQEPDSRAKALRSMALLDLFQGHYGSAEERFEEAISLHQAKSQWLSEARVVLLLSTLKGGLDDRRGQLDELERAASALMEHEPQNWLLTRVGVELARVGELERASQLFDVIQNHTDLENAQQRADLHRLEGELELALDHPERALELLELAVRDHHLTLYLESLARAYRLSGHSEKAVLAYEKLVMEKRSKCTGWEMQQPWIAAHLHLARLHSERGDTDRALEVIGEMLELWQDADPDLPLLQAATQLHGELAASG